jgi:hypothetical protein
MVAAVLLPKIGKIRDIRAITAEYVDKILGTELIKF